MRRFHTLAFVACVTTGSVACLLSAATEWQIGPFTRAADDAVIRPDPRATFLDPVTHRGVHWEALHTFNPAAVVRNGTVVVLYRAEDDSGSMMIGGHTSRIGLAESADGVHFTRRPQPVLFPADDDQKEREWPGGCEDPRVVESEDGLYVVTYTQWNQKTYDAGVATSWDLVHWTKYGPVFAKAKNGKYAGLKYKSAAIVTRLSGERLTAAKIDGSYWMFWGEGSIHLARSSNLIDWDPVETPDGELVSVLGPRPGKFDSSFPEAGPPPVLLPQGLLTIYNGKNSPTQGDPALAADAYSAGQALFAARAPMEMLHRLSEPFFRPEKAFERSGQYAAGTTFVEGLVRFQNKWWIYYGCADALVGVAKSK